MCLARGIAGVVAGQIEEKEVAFESLFCVAYGGLVAAVFQIEFAVVGCALARDWKTFSTRPSGSAFPNCLWQKKPAVNGG
jgi:hypothetical protein